MELADQESGFVGGRCSDMSLPTIYEESSDSMRVGSRNSEWSTRPTASVKRTPMFGVEAASREAIAFSDADDEVGEGWLAAMSSALARHDFVGC